MKASLETSPAPSIVCALLPIFAIRTIGDVEHHLKLSLLLPIVFDSNYDPNGRVDHNLNRK
jgi:hypothetical protein